LGTNEDVVQLVLM